MLLTYLFALQLPDICVFYLYIIPLLDIFITNVVPTITITDIEHKIANSTLNISPICSNSFIILVSAIGSLMLANILYDIVNIAIFIIGIMHIPIIITTPMTPIAFFNIIPQPKTVSTASPNIFPTIGMLLLTIAFAVFAVIPSILLDNVPSKEITPTNVVSITPKIHIIPELNVFDILSICTLSPIFDTILSVAAINTAGIKKTLYYISYKIYHK